MLGDRVRRFALDRTFARDSPSLRSTRLSASPGQGRYSKRRVFLLGFVVVRGVVLLISLTTTAGGPELPASYCRVGG
jgi:hypothetical protein